MVMKKGDLFIYRLVDKAIKENISAPGVCLEQWGYNSHNEKLYKVYIDGKIDIISERDIKEIVSKQT